MNAMQVLDLIIEDEIDAGASRSCREHAQHGALRSVTPYNTRPAETLLEVLTGIEMHLGATTGSITIEPEPSILNSLRIGICRLVKTPHHLGMPTYKFGVWPSLSTA